MGKGVHRPAAANEVTKSRLGQVTIESNHLPPTAQQGVPDHRPHTAAIMVDGIGRLIARILVDYRTQRAFVVKTPKGNLLWDCVPHLDEATFNAVKALGGIAAIAVSHPHYYTTMVEWSHAFGKVPVHIHDADRKWAMRPDPVIDFWKGEVKDLFGGLKLVNTGGHFDGFQVLHWPAGAKDKGVLLSGDQPQVCRDRRWVSFMYSYPNLIPLPAKAIRRIVAALKPLEYEKLYGAFPGLTVAKDAKGAVERSAARYLKAIGV
jgi:hypothetical protein